MNDGDKKLKSYRFSLWAGSLVLVYGAVVLILYNTADLMNFIVVLMGFTVMTQDFWKYTGIQKPAKDERARKIGTMAGLYSWYVALLAAVLVLTAISFFNVRIGTMQVLGVILLVLVLSFLGFNVYFGRKGDVE